jgi:stage V sporulation protein G
MLEIKVNRMNRFDDTDKKLRAFVDIEVNDSLLVKGLRVMNGINGLFVAMPRQKGKDDRWYETVRPLSPAIKDQIVSIVLEAYEASLAETQP